MYLKKLVSICSTRATKTTPMTLYQSLLPLGMIYLGLAMYYLMSGCRSQLYRKTKQKKKDEYSTVCFDFSCQAFK